MPIQYAPNYGYNGWPGSYPPPTPVVPPTPVKMEVVRVHGEEGAKAFSMGPNSSVLLLDETQPVVWLKTTDGASYPTVTGYAIAPLVQDPKVVDVQKPVETVQETIEDRILARLDRLERMIENVQPDAQPVAKYANSSSNDRQQRKPNIDRPKSDQVNDRNA